jgi:integrase
MRRYYLHTRNGIFYAEILTSEGKKITARSTGTRDREKAEAIADDWHANGLPPPGNQKKIKVEGMSQALSSILGEIRKADLDQSGAMAIVAALRERNLIDFGITRTSPGREKLIPFLTRFWDMDTSPYLRDKAAHGRKITASYCRASIQKISCHWQPRFGDNRPMNDITRSDLREFSLSLKEKGLACNTVNNIMMVGTTAIKWAYIEGIIQSDPSAGLSTFTGDKVSRDILTEEETEALFKINWRDKRAYTASLLSLTTGLRSGEIRALRKNDIGGGILHVTHSWNNIEGLKCPKNGERRVVPLLPQVRAMLLQLLQETPHRENINPFVFYSDRPHKPCSSNLFLRYFRIACGSLCACTRFNIDFKKRKLDFHSFRHAFSTRMAERMEGNKVAKITGHRSEAAARIYQWHITARILSEMENAATQEFKNILDSQTKKRA